MDNLPKDFKRPMGAVPLSPLNQIIADTHAQVHTGSEIEALKEAYSRQASTIRWLEQVVKRAEQGYDNLAGVVKDQQAALKAQQEAIVLLNQWVTDLSGRVPV